MRFGMKRVLTFLLVLVLSLAVVTGCVGGAATPTTSPTSGTNATPTPDPSAEWKIPEITLQNKTIRILMAGPAKVPSYLTPIAEKLLELYGAEIDYIGVPGTQTMEKLATMVLADDSPDMFIGDQGYYPAVVYKDLTQPLDEIIDYNDPFWASVTNPITKDYTISGKNYIFLKSQPDPRQYVFYNRRLLEDAGLDDPQTLFMNGTWDFTVFMDMCKKLTVDTDKNGTMDQFGMIGASINIGLAFLFSNGARDCLFEATNGKLVNNLSDPKFEKGAEWYYKFYSANVIDPQWLADNNVNVFSNGTVGFLVGPPSLGILIKDMISTDEAGMVPFPKNPDSDKYYYYNHIEGYSLPVGAKNVDGFKALLVAMLLSSPPTNVEQLQGYIDSANAKEALALQKQYDIDLATAQAIQKSLHDWRTKSDMAETYVMSYGVTGSLADLNPIDNMARDMYLESGWSAVREKYSPYLDAVIAAFE